jgi:hypothetical protein
MLRALAISVLLTRIFVADVVQWVKTEIQKQIALDVRADQRSQKVRHDTETARNRSLRLWSEARYPLSTNKEETIMTLIRAIVHIVPEGGLRAGSVLVKTPERTSYTKLSRAFYDVAVHGSAKVKAPMTTGSSYLERCWWRRRHRTRL